MSDVFEQLRKELRTLMAAKHHARDIKLLNVGSNNADEWHWRFRLPSGEIVNVSVERES